MYRNLEAEIARAGLNKGQLANLLGITKGTMSLKLNGQSPLTLAECKKIKRILEYKGSIEILFAQD